MADWILLILVFGGVVLGIWISYRLFMRGDTYQRVASYACRQLQADWSWRQGDTYVGYESGNHLGWATHTTVSRQAVHR
jgi:hypothetical protein